MVHFTWNFNSIVIPVLTTGIGYSTNNDQLRYLLGFGIILQNFLGSQNLRLILNVEAINGNEKVLSQKFSEDQTFNKIPTLETMDKNYTKIFYSLSFNFLVNKDL